MSADALDRLRFREIDGHRIQLLEGGGLIWEHDTLPGYRVSRHMVGTKDGATWSVINDDPLSLMPSLHCEPARGGCGRHGFVSNDRWVEA